MSDKIKALIIVIVIIAVLLIHYIWFYGLKSEKGEEIGLEAIAKIIADGELVDDITVQEGERVHFTAEESSGNIVSYKWAIRKGGEGDDIGAMAGRRPVHTFSDPGYYIIVLSVKDRTGNISKDRVHVFVTYLAEYDKTISYSDRDDETFPVEWGTIMIVVNLSYEPERILNKNINNLDLYVFDTNGTLAGYSNDSLDPNADSTLYEEVIVTDQFVEKGGTGEWSAEVDCTSGTNIDYRLRIEVIYGGE